MYTGFTMSFYAGIYPTAVGNSKLMPNAMAIVGMVGIFTGIGEVSCGGLFVFGSKFMNKIPRNFFYSTAFFSL